MIHEAWNEVSETTVARCWMKADILLRGIQAAFSANNGKVTGTRDPKKEFDILEISVNFSKLQLQASGDTAKDLREVCDEDIRNWIVIEDDYEVREALVNDCLEAAEKTATVVTGPQGVPELFEAQEDEISVECEAVPPLPQVAKLFQEAENLALRTGVAKASEGLRRAKRAFYEAYHNHTRKRNRPTLIVEHFKYYSS